MVKLYHRINISYARVLRVTYRDYKSTVVQLLQKDNFVIIDLCNLQVLDNAFLKAKKDLSAKIMKEVFELKESSCSLHSKGNFFVCGHVKTIH